MFQKTVALLLMPAGLLGMLLLMATLWHWKRSRKTGALFLMCTLLYGLCGNPRVGNWLIVRLESAIPPQDLADLPVYDAVYVLGGGTELNPARDPELGDAGDRVARGAMLWHAGKAKCLVAGGAFAGAKGFERNLGEETRILWLRLGVPDSAICVMNGPSSNTREEMDLLARTQVQYGWRRLGLLSSAWHLPRVMALANARGIVADPIGSDWQGRSRAWQLQDLVPQEKGFRRIQLAVWEFLGRLSGRSLQGPTKLVKKMDGVSPNPEVP